MKIYNNLFPDVKIIKHKKIDDNRGNFCETWKIENDGMRGTYRQLNTVVSSQFVLRGMHSQDQYKLVMPVYGKIFDVVLDPIKAEWCAVELDENISLLIPPQYAHGYMALTEKTIVQYIVDKPYNKYLEKNFKWDNYNIDWPNKIIPILSEKDK